MAEHYDDPPEMVSTPAGAPKIKADPPKGKPAVVPPIAAAPVAPTPAIAGNAADDLAASQNDLSTTMNEVQAATGALRVAEREEADAVAAFTRAVPPLSADAVHRKMLADDTARKLARIAAGEAPTPAKVPTHGRSPTDIAAASRPRPVPGTVAPTLRSGVARRVV